MASESYTPSEMMAAVAARELGNREVVFVGIGLPNLACNLARALQASGIEAGDRVAKGDVVYLTESVDGYRLTPYNPSFAAQMETAREIMKRRRNALRELAK